MKNTAFVLERVPECIMERILELEWGMFSEVKNVGGQASCQTDRASFDVMRKSQARSLSPECWKAGLQTWKTLAARGATL